MHRNVTPKSATDEVYVASNDLMLVESNMFCSVSKPILFSSNSSSMDEVWWILRKLLEVDSGVGTPKNEALLQSAHVLINSIPIRVSRSNSKAEQISSLLMVYLHEKERFYRKHVFDELM
jgi:hypothetical protein